MKKKIIITITISIIIIIFLIGYLDFETAEVFQNTVDIVYSTEEIPDDLQAVGSLSDRQQDLICAVSRGLIDVDSEGNILPSLAESVDITDGGIEYNFTIRDDVYWSDGSKITPKEIVDFFQDAIKDESEEDLVALLNVYGVKEYIEDDDLNFNSNVAITYTDTNVIMRLNSPDDNFLVQLSKPQYKIRKNLLAWGKIKDNYTSLIYSGEYGISSMGDDEIILSKNNYSTVSLPQTIYMVQDDSEDLALAAFEIGTRDIVINPPTSELERLRKEENLITTTSDKAIYMSFNLENESIDVTGRRKLYSLFTDTLESYIESNVAAMEIADGAYYREEKEQVDLLQERKVLTNEENTWSTDDNIVVIMENTLDNKEIINTLSEWSEDNTSFSFVFQLLDKDELDEAMKNGNYDVALFDIDTNIENNSDFYNILSQYSSDATVTTDASTIESFYDLEDDLFNSYKIVPLCFYNENIAINETIKNIELDYNGNIDFNSIEML